MDSLAKQATSTMINIYHPKIILAYQAEPLKATIANSRHHFREEARKHLLSKMLKQQTNFKSVIDLCALLHLVWQK